MSLLHFSVIFLLWFFKSLNHKYEYFPSAVEKASHYRRHRSRSHSSSTFGTGLGDDKSEISEIYPSFSCCSEVTRPSDEGGSKFESVSENNNTVLQTCRKCA